MSLRRLIERGGAFSGAVHRLVDFRERQDLLGGEPRTPIIRVDWRKILERRSRGCNSDRPSLRRDQARIAPLKCAEVS